MLPDHPPIGADPMTDLTLPRQPPRPQDPAAARTGKPPSEQVAADRNVIIIYREHQRGAYSRQNGSA
jgi:hypothetical protein